MPMYDYYCKTCPRRVTESRGITDDAPNPTCTKCNTLMTRIYAAPAVTFSGDGWGGDHKKGNRK